MSANRSNVRRRLPKTRSATSRPWRSLTSKKISSMSRSAGAVNSNRGGHSPLRSRSSMRRRTSPIASAPSRSSPPSSAATPSAIWSRSTSLGSEELLALVKQHQDAGVAVLASVARASIRPARRVGAHGALGRPYSGSLRLGEGSSGDSAGVSASSDWLPGGQGFESLPACQNSSEFRSFPDDRLRTLHR